MKPILFNTEMTRAILNNRKTVTRRVVKQNTDTILSSQARTEHPELSDAHFINKLCLPPYQSGDILYVRETWCWCPCWDCGMNTEKGCCDDIANRFYNDQRKEYGCYGYKASFETNELPFDKWYPSIHMPKEVARLFLRVTGVRVERLQEITIDGIEQEGITLTFPLRKLIDSEHLKRFIQLWNSTIKPADISHYGWDANPWVWVVEFEKCEKPKED